LSGGLYERIDHALGVEAGWRLTGREIVERGDVLLDDRGGR
jgi:hypothetical protein